jgi:hypothetical protein
MAGTEAARFFRGYYPTIVRGRDYKAEHRALMAAMRAARSVGTRERTAQRTSRPPQRLKATTQRVTGRKRLAMR